MGGPQTLLTIGALMLLSSLILSLNNAILGRDLMNYESEATLTAISIGQSLLEEVRTRAFDENTVPPDRASSPADLTYPDYLGHEDGEEGTEDFDDIDDYAGFERSVTTTRFGDFKQAVRVYYVRNTNLADSSNFPTFLKRIDVGVWNSYVGTPTNTITLSTVIGYR